MLDITGVLTFSNFLLVISIVLMFSAFVWLFGIYFATIVLLMPAEMIEVVLYSGLSYALYKTQEFFGSELGYIWGLFFALGLTTTTIITGIRTKGDNIQLFNFANMVIHAVAGIYLKSSLISAVSILFLMGLIGFQIGIGPGFVTVGYKEKDVIATATVVSGIITLIGTYFSIELASSISLSPFLNNVKLFLPGMLWFGPFVFFLSMLIVSSSSYCGVRYNHKSENYNTYVNNNIMTIVLSLSAVLCGNLYGISQLSGYSGTFFVLYIFQKYFEVMPNNKETWAWTTLFLGALLYMINVYYRTEIEMYGIHQYFNILPPIHGVN